MTGKRRPAFWLAIIFLSLAELLSWPTLCQAPRPGRLNLPRKIYIAPFRSQDSIDPKLLASFRDLFEESFERLFSRDGIYTLLNRETIERVLAEAKDEAALGSVEQLNTNLKGQLKIANAEGFVFGQVSDDKSSGDIVISAKLQGFDTTVYWNESVTMRRGHINDRSDRKDAMEQLVRSISASAQTDEKVPVTFIMYSPDPEAQSGTTKDCADLASLRSVKTPGNVQIDFVNASPNPRNLYWVGFDGKLILYNSLAPQAGIRALTYEAHDWVITDSLEHCLAIYVVGKKPNIVTITH